MEKIPEGLEVEGTAPDSAVFVPDVGEMIERQMHLMWIIQGQMYRTSTSDIDRLQKLAVTFNALGEGYNNLCLMESYEVGVMEEE